MPPDDCTERYEAILAGGTNGRYVLRLFVTGLTARSTLAIDTIKGICEKELKGRCELEVIDITKRPQSAKEEDIIAAPTLVKKLPLPLRKLIGDLSNRQRVLVGLNIEPKA